MKKTLLISTVAGALIFSGAAVAAGHHFTGCISSRDHYNSQGHRLHSANKVLQQFLAHRYHFSRYGDAFFANSKHRMKVGRSYVKGPYRLKKAIRYGTPCFHAYYKHGVTYVRWR